MRNKTSIRPLMQKQNLTKKQEKVELNKLLARNSSLYRITNNGNKLCKSPDKIFQFQLMCLAQVPQFLSGDHQSIDSIL